MHKKRHMIKTAGRREKEEGEKLNTLVDKVLRKPIDVTSLTGVPYSLPNLSKRLSTSHLHFDFNILCPRSQFLVTYNNHINDGEKVASLSRGFLAPRKQ